MDADSYTWSYSSLDLFDQCPHKYYRLRVKKDIKEPPSEHLSYGLDVHKAAEEFIRDGVPIPEKYSYLVPALTKLRDYEGEKLCEYRMGLTRKLEPCAFYDKQVWWRGIADLIVLQGDSAKIVDYKTGKSSKYADTKQLELLSLAVFKHFPQVKRVKGGLLFVVAGDFIRDEYSADKVNVYWERWLTGTARLEQAFEVSVWNPRPNFTCSKWCPVKDCAHNGKR
jgi:hypothetical protein